MTNAAIGPCPGRAEAFRLFVLEAPLNAVLLDLDVRFVAASPSYLQNTRSTLDQIIGRKLFDVVPGSEDGFITVTEALAAGHSEHEVTREIGIQGRRSWIRAQATYWHDDNGDVCGYMILNQDVTAAHEAEQRRREMEILLRAVVDNIPATVTVQDFETGEYLLVNEGITRATGKSADEMLGRRAGELFRDAWDSLAEQFQAAPKEGGVAVIDYEVVGGAVPDMTLQLKRLVFEDVAGRKRLLSIGDDVTELRRATKALEAAVAEAEAANAAKSNFLANVSHEIRTPLNGVLGMAQAMTHDPLPTKQQERLDVIRQSGEVLLALLNDLLDMSKIEAGKLELESLDFDLAEIVEGASAAFKVVAEQKGLAFDVRLGEAAGLCRGDPTRVRQVIANLVSNALKFTDRGRIEVAAARSGDDVHFSISDTGLGMSPATVEKLFTKFAQADASTTRRFGGTGLGLAICRDLVEMMGGRISVESTEGEGSCFAFALPLRRVSKLVSHTPAAQSVGAAPRKLRILAAEDNRINQRVLEALLEAAGLAPVFVNNGAEAIDAWAREHWDVILMDVQMPVLDGPAATAEIRRREVSEQRPRTPIVALTANAMAHQANEYLGGGMDAVVSKPIQAKALMEAITQVACCHNGVEPAHLTRSA